MTSLTPGRLIARSTSQVLKATDSILNLAQMGLAGPRLAVNWVRLRYLDYVPRPDDIFIATYPRSGTTWLQMALYQLTTDGNMEFDHICRFVPWYELSVMTGRDLEALPSPRVFKTHLPYRSYLRNIPKGPARYIYCARNGRDVLVSYYYFYISHFGFRGTFEEFFEMFMRGRVRFGSWFKHVADWWERRNDPNVLFLRYEDLTGELEGSLHKIADFCGLKIEPAQLPRILERCSLPFMKKHENKFDHIIEQIIESQVNLGHFIRTGGVGGWRDHLNDQQITRFDQEYDRRLGLTEINLSGR